MSTGGTYRINDTEFPAPITGWQPQVIGAKLNGLPSLNSYFLHTWQWPAGALEDCYMEDLLAAFELQNDTGTQLSALETDPSDASDASDGSYGTVVYDDFVIKEILPRTKQLSVFESPTVTFEVYIG
jgi:hypothetical protein